jgi:hypothetical protein
MKKMGKMMDGEYTPLSETIDRIAAMPNGQLLAEVLKIVQKETDALKARVSSDFHRAILREPGGGLVSVRVTVARQSRPHGPWLFRFKSPSDSSKFRALFFGGLNQRGAPVVHKLTAADIGPKKTITLPAH